MVVPIAMAGAFFVTTFASPGTELESGEQYAFVRSSSPGRQIGRHAADVGTVKIDADALTQMLDDRLGNAGVST